MLYESEKQYSFWLAIVFVAISLIGAVMARGGRPSHVERVVEEPHIKITSSVKKDTRLHHFAQELQGRERTQKEINHLISELAKGNTNPGMGSEHLNDAGHVMYARGRNGGRVYYILHGSEAYEILGYSDKNNQERVIRYLREKYNRH